MPARLAVVATIVALVVTVSGVRSFAEPVPFPEVPGWQAFATTYLSMKDGSPYDVATSSRCVKLNNYPCIKQRAKPWLGSGRGARDFAGHSMFVHPKWSIVADFQWFWTHSGNGAQKVSAFTLAETYSPWCDTVGSFPTKPDRTGRQWGRNCGASEGPPVGFKGPLCSAPALGHDPAPEQCDACNCPNVDAGQWLKGSGHRIDEKLALFDARKKPTADLENLITGLVAFESGKYKPKPNLMSEAESAFVPQ